MDSTVARLRLSEAAGGLDFGRELGRVGEFRVGVFRGLGEARVKVGDPSIPNIDFNTGGAFARLRFVQWTLSRPGLGADSDFDTVEAEVSQTWSRGKNSIRRGVAARIAFSLAWIMRRRWSRITRFRSTFRWADFCVYRGLSEVKSAVRTRRSPSLSFTAG
jgi:hypothetical protein